MTKAILKKSLALLISVMLVLTAFGGALAVFAEDAVVEEEVAFDYGTEADGFNTRHESGADDGNPTVNQVPVLEVPTNLNFKEGLKYWTSKSDKAGLAGEYATVYTANGEKYIGFNLDNKQFDGITSPWFGLGDIADGTKIYVFAEYMLNGKLTDTGWNVFGDTKYPINLSVLQMDTEGTLTNLKTKHESVPMDDAQKNGIWSTQDIHEFNYVAGATYRIQMQDAMPSDAEAVVDAETSEITTEAITTRATIAEMTDGEAAIFVKGIRFCTLNDDGTYTEIGTGAQLYKTGLPIGGTEAEGIPVNMINGGWYDIYNWGTNAKTAKNTALYVPQEGFQNGDFSEGFKYWTVRWPSKGYGINSVDDVYKIVDGYVQFKGNEKNYLGLGAVPFKLSNVKAGDKLIATADVKNNGGKALMLNLGEVGVDNVYVTDRSNTTDWVSISTPELTVSADNATFGIMFESHAGTTAGHSIDNVRVLKVNADGTFTDVMTGDSMYANGDPVQPLGGTEADGIIINGDNYISDKNSDSMDKTNYAFGVADKFTNYNFSEGFKYYSTGYNSALEIDSISDFWEITDDGTAKQKNNPYLYSHITSMPFYLKDVKAGDTLRIGVTLKKNTGVEIRLFENNKKMIGFSNSTTYSDWVSLTSSEFDVSADDSFFWFTLRNNTSTSDANIEVKEFFVLKKLANGTYINLFTGENVYKDNIAVGGTYEDGWYAGVSADNIMNVGTYDAFNGDFSQGLRYWGWQHNSTGFAASDAAKLMTEENGNTYVNMFDNSTAWAGIRTVGFKIDSTKIAEGDQLTVMFNYRNGNLGSHRVFLGVANADSTWTLNNDKFGTAVVLADGDSWGTAVTMNYITVGSGIKSLADANHGRKTSDVDDHIWFYVEIEADGTNKGSIDLDNFQVVKYINAKTVKTLDGETITFEPTWVGTFSGGATVSGNNALDKFYPEYGLYNADFEQGLKYWAGRGTSGNNATLTNYVNLVQTEDNNYFQFNGVTATSYSGLMTAKISVPAATFAQGDMATLVVDVYDPNNTMSNVQAVLAVYNGSTEVRLGQGTFKNAKVIADKGNGWKTMLVPYTNNAINFTSTETNTVAEGDWAMVVVFEVPEKKASTTALDNIKIVKRVGDNEVVSINGETITWEPTWVGTFSGGATISGSNALSKFYPEYGLYNADFEQGLKYWAGRGTNVNNATLTNYVNLVQTEDNNYVQFNGVTATAYSGLMTAKISVPAATFAQGDMATLVVDVYDPNNTMSNVQAVLAVYNGSTEVRLGQGTFKNAKVIADKGNGWKTMLVPYTNNAINFTSTETNTVAEGDWAMVVAFEVPTGKASTTALDNIKIVKRVTEYSVVSIDGETIEWAPDWAGTFEGGAIGAGAWLNSKYPAEYGIANGDFSEGLKYWGATGGTATAITDYVDLVNDGDNYYIQLDGVARDGYCGFRTGYLCIPAADLQVGDYAALKFDIYDPENTASAFQVILTSRGNDGAAPRVSLTTGSALKVVADKGNGWKTVVSEFDVAIPAVCTEKGAFKSGDWVFDIAVEVIATSYEEARDEEGNILKDENGKTIYATDENGNKIVKNAPKSNAAFDNFEIVRADRGGFGKDALAVDFDGNALGEILVGDANLDGKVDLVDLVRTKKYIAGQASSGDKSPISFVSVDADASKTIDAADITVIINKLLGL